MEASLKVAAGQDGSFTAFYLPFQDLTTSNHIGVDGEDRLEQSAAAAAPAAPLIALKGSAAAPFPKV